MTWPGIEAMSFQRLFIESSDGIFSWFSQIDLKPRVSWFTFGIEIPCIERHLYCRGVVKSAKCLLCAPCDTA